MKHAMYVAMSSSGVVKIGRSANPQAREKQIAAMFLREFGSPLHAFEVCGWVVDFPTETEAACLALIRLELKPRRTRREWFFGIDFRSSVALVRGEVEAEQRRETERASRHAAWLKRQQRSEAFQ